MPPIRVLVIDDDPEVIRLLQATLGEKYEILWATNGMEGLQMAFEGQPDLVVSDIRMPVMDGREFIRRLRLYPNFEKTPVVFLSGLTATDDIREGYNLGAALYLSKPIDPTRLRRNLDLFVDDNGVVGSPKQRSAGEIQAALSSARAGGTGSRPAAHASHGGTSPAATNPGSPRAHSYAPHQTRPPVAHAPHQTRPPATAHAPHQTRPPVAHAPHQTRPPATAHVELAGELGRRDPAKKEQPRPRILVVEHDAEVLRSIVGHFENDCEMVPAADGIEAIERAVRYLPDIFIVDLYIPKMTSVHLVSMIRRNRVFQRAPIVVLQGKEEHHLKRQLQQTGIEHFLPTPPDLRRLGELLGQFVGAPGFEPRAERPRLREVLLELGLSERIREPRNEALRASHVLRAYSRERQEG